MKDWKADLGFEVVKFEPEGQMPVFLIREDGAEDREASLEESVLWNTLMAQQPAASGEAVAPVSWAQLGMRNGHTYVRMHYEGHIYPPSPDVQRNLNLVPLYASPQPPAAPAPAQRLTLRQIAEATAGYGHVRSDHAIGIAKAIETACAVAWGVSLRGITAASAAQKGE